MNENINQRTLNAVKWSSMTEIVAKIISPITNMLLARILAPEAFGVLATVTMITSFADVFVDSGFQKFLIQHEFTDEEEENKYTSVAFWSNLTFAFLIWIVICVFQNPLANLVGNEGLGRVLAIASGSIPIHAMVGIQDCTIKKKLEFKKLFYVRIPAALVPLLITLPLALLGFDYWSLIIGNISGVILRSVLIMVVGGYRPHLYFSLKKLKYMLKYGIVTLLDGLAIWSTNWIDALLIANMMSEYQLGLYRNSVSMVTSVFLIITSAVTPVLYSALSKLQDDEKAFSNLFLNTQKILCLFLLPLGIGISLYSDLATDILFGENWSDAAFIVGITAFTLTLRTIFVSINSDAYRAKGKFKIPLLLQIIDLCILVPACILSSNIGFEALVYTRALARLGLVIPSVVMLYVVCKISPRKTLLNILPSCIATIFMVIVALILQRVSTAIVWQFISIVFCAMVYLAGICMFRNERKVVMMLISKVTHRK